MTQNDLIQNLNISLSNVKPNELLNYSFSGIKDLLSQNTLIFSCFDPKIRYNEYSDFLKYSYQHNGLYFIDDDKSIYALNQNVSNRYGVLGIDSEYNSFIKMNVDESIFGNYIDNILGVDNLNLNLADNVAGIFMPNTLSLEIKNNVLEINEEYGNLIQNFNDIITKITKIDDNATKLSKMVKKLKQYKNLNPIIDVVVKAPYDMPIIFDDNNSFYEVSNVVDEGIGSKNYDACNYLPLFAINDNTSEFNVCIPFRFIYASKYGFPNYQSFFDKSIVTSKVYKVKINNNVLSDDALNQKILKKIHDDLEVIDKDTYGEVFTIEPANNLLIYDKNKSCVVDFKIYDVKIINETNVYFGQFYYSMNFIVNHYSNFDFGKILVNINNGKSEYRIPICVRFNNQPSESKIYQTLYHNYSQGYNFNGNGKPIGICAIPKNFYGENSKPIFVKIKKNINYIIDNNDNNNFALDLIDNETYETNVSISALPINSNYFNDSDNNEYDSICKHELYQFNLCPHKFKTFIDVRPDQKYKIYLKSNKTFKSHISDNKFIFYDLEVNSPSIINNVSIKSTGDIRQKVYTNQLLNRYTLQNNIIDYQLYYFYTNPNEPNTSSHGYIEENHTWYYGGQRALNWSTTNKDEDPIISSIGTNVIYNDWSGAQNTILENVNVKSKYGNRFKNIFPNIYELCDNGLRKGDCWPANLQELKILSELNIFKIFIPHINTTIFSSMIINENLVVNESSYPCIYGITHQMDKKQMTREIGNNDSFVVSNNFHNVIVKKQLSQSYDNETLVPFKTMKNMLPLFKLPDFNILNSNDYYLYYDQKLNYEILDMLESNYNISINIQSHLDNVIINDNQFICVPIDDSIDILPINALNYNISYNKLNINISKIKKLIASFLIIYKDSDNDFNTYEYNDEKYRILCRIFIKK